MDLGGHHYRFWLSKLIRGGIGPYRSDTASARLSVQSLNRNDNAFKERYYVMVGWHQLEEA